MNLAKQLAGNFIISDRSNRTDKLIFIVFIKKQIV